jgi:hypothetical protein
MPIKIGKYKIGKECGGKWFPGFGYGYWDGWSYYRTNGYKKTFNLKFRTFNGGFAIGPLMVWRASLDERRSNVNA